MSLQKIKKIFSTTKAKIISLLMVVLIGVSAMSVAIYQDHMKLYGTHIKVGNYEISTLEYNFYKKTYEDSFVSKYSDYLETLGIDTNEDYGNQQCLEYDMTWNEYFEGRTLEFIQEIYILYDDALKNNFNIDSAKFYDDFIKKSTEAATSEELTLNEYLSGYYSSGATEKNFKDIYERYITAIKYREEKKKALSPTDSEIDDFYVKNKNLLDVVTYRNFVIKAECSKDATETEKKTAMEEAKKKAEEMFKQIYDEDKYVELCKKYASKKDSTKDYAKETLHEKVSYTDCNEALSGWLFDDSREINATAIIEDSTNMEYNIVYFISRSKNTTKTVNFKHILIAPEIDSEGNVVNNGWAKAKEKADKTYDEWSKSDKKSETFDSMVKEYSDDTETVDDCGEYESIAEGTLPEKIDKWLFEKERKEGDYTLVKTESGYHILYYLEPGKEEWKVISITQITEDRYQKFIDAQLPKFKVIDVKGEIKYLQLSTADQAISTKDSINK